MIPDLGPHCRVNQWTPKPKLGAGNQLDAIYYLLYDKFGTFILNISICSGKKGTDSVHSDAALKERAVSRCGLNSLPYLYKSKSGTFQLNKSIVVRCIHHAWHHLLKQMQFIWVKAFSWLPSSVLGWRVTHPVWIYSIICLNTSGSNSSISMVWWCPVKC